MTRMLPAAKFDLWQNSSLTGDETKVIDALRGYYVWANNMNLEMQEREDTENNSVGQIFDSPPKTLDLDDKDVAALDEGMSRIENAHMCLQTLIAALGTTSSA